MCADPITLTVVGATLFSAATTAMQGYSAASVARYNAQQEQRAAFQNEELSREKSRRMMSDQFVALANTGARPDTDTPLLLLGESARNAALDALQIRQTGRAKAAAYETEASNAVTTGLFGAGAQLLGGAVALQKLGKINPPTNGNPPPVAATSATATVPRGR